MDHTIAKIISTDREKNPFTQKNIWRSDFNYRVKLQKHIGEMLCVLN